MGKRPSTTSQAVNVAASCMCSLYPGVNAHAGQYCELCLSAHVCLPGTLQYYTYSSRWKTCQGKVE